jgi:Flp pilus assembly protein TadD
VACSSACAAFNHLQRSLEAAKDASLALYLNPLSDAAYNIRAYAFCRLQRYDLAWRDADQAIRLNPNNDSAYGNRSSCAVCAQLFFFCLFILMLSC